VVEGHDASVGDPLTLKQVYALAAKRGEKIEFAEVK
jgi:hypothetical protein